MIHAYLSIVGLRTISICLAAIFIGFVTFAVQAEDFGRFSLILSLIQVIGTGTLSFCNLALLRYAREEYAETESIGVALGTRMFIHIVTLAIILPLAWLISPAFLNLLDLGEASIGILLFGLLIIPLNEMGTVAAQSVGRYVGFGASPLIFRSIQISCLFLMFILSITAWEFLAIGTLLGYAVGGAIAWASIPISALKEIRFRLSSFKKFLTYSWSIPFALLSVVLLNWQDLWFIQYFLDTKMVGVYAWGYNISLLAAAMLAPLSALMSTNVIDLSLKNAQGKFKQYSEMANSVFYLAVCIFPMLAILFGLFFNLIPLGDYHNAIIPAQLLILAIVFQSGRVFWEAVVFAYEKTAAIGAAIMVGMAIINGLLNLLLVPTIGVSGAAISTLAAFSFGMLGLYLSVRSRVEGGQENLLSTSMLGFVPLVVVGFVIYFNTLTASILGLIFCIVFTGYCWQTQCFKGIPNLLSLDINTRGEEDTLIGRILLFLANARSNETGKINIMVCVNHLGIGGTERHLLQILPRLTQYNVNIQLVVLRSGGALEKTFLKSGISVFAPPENLPVWSQRFYAFFLLLWKMIKDRPDIVHFYLPEAYLVGGLAALLARVPVRVMSRRSLNKYQNKHPVFSYFEKKLHKHMTACIGNSNKVCQQLIDEAVPGARVKLIYNGVDTSDFSVKEDKEYVRSRLNIKSDSFVILIVANLIQYKGHVDLLKAVALIKDKLGINWELICVGRDDGIGKNLEQEVERLGISKHIRWYGETKDPLPLYQASDVGVLCSHEEGFSNSILEYMACQLPVVATTVGGNAESVQQGETGFLVPPQNPEKISEAILKLFEDPDMRISFGLKGRQVILDKFSVEDCLHQYINLYTALSCGQEVIKGSQVHA